MSKSIRELIVNVPTPSSDERENETSALLETDVIETRVVRTHLDWRVRDVEFGWSNATGFEVDEDDSLWGAEKVARVRFSVQQLVGGSTPLDGFGRAVKRTDEKVPVAVSQRGAFAPAGDNALRRRDPLHEMRCFNLDVSHCCV